ncbi:MAG: hypothetical protein GY898_28960 [Proteobacteria bacterium]|nr:hypothetical protein [Pseudomonadota bacterium]
MSPRADEFRALGAALHVVSNGTVQHLNWFMEDTEPDFDGSWTDPSRKSYDAAGMLRGRLRTLGPKAAAQGLRAARGGHKQKGVKGDAWQQGGVWIVMPDGSVPWTYTNDNAGDHADPDTILTALKAAVA